jgi:UDP-glucose:O-linked fucose beta-1,3-glucosyltransferase
MIESQLSQVEVNRMAENFRKIHQERQELLSQLENSVRNMRHRDQEIGNAQTLNQELRQQLYDKQEAINEKRALLENQEDDNATTEKNIAADERLLARMKTEYTAMKNDLSQLQGEVDMLKMTLHKSTI